MAYSHRVVALTSVILLTSLLFLQDELNLYLSNPPPPGADVMPRMQSLVDVQRAIEEEEEEKEKEREDSLDWSCFSSSDSKSTENMSSSLVCLTRRGHLLGHQSVQRGMFRKLKWRHPRRRRVLPPPNGWSKSHRPMKSYLK